MALQLRPAFPSSKSPDNPHALATAKVDEARKWRHVWANTAVELLEVSPAAIVLRTNPAFESEFGWGDRLIGQPMSDFTHFEDRAACGDQVRQCVDGGRDTIECTMRYITKDKQVLTRRMHGIAIRADDNEVLGFLVELLRMDTPADLQRELRKELESAVENAKSELRREMSVFHKSNGVSVVTGDRTTNELGAIKVIVWGLVMLIAVVSGAITWWQYYEHGGKESPPKPPVVGQP
jgi:PAS domain S-box-containing protein